MCTIVMHDIVQKDLAIINNFIKIHKLKFHKIHKINNFVKIRLTTRHQHL